MQLERTMNFITYGLLEFLKSHNNNFNAEDGIIISADENRMIKVAKKLVLSDNRSGELYKRYTPEEFTTGMCQSIDVMATYDLETLLNPQQPIYVNIPDLDMELTFRMLDDDMIVTNLSDHFYDEIEELDVLEDYIDYLNNSEGLLHAVYEGRNKYFNSGRRK